jgi:hypothetical protein
MQIQGQYAPAGTTWYNSAAAEETKSVKASPGLLFCVAITNSNAGARFAYLFDATSATGTPIVPPIPIAAGAQVIVALPYAVPFNTGLFVAASSTNATFTAAAGNDFRMSVLFK